ncbi:MAG: ComEC/Rec2 family competence protein [Vicinamibacterales bacterium]
MPRPSGKVVLVGLLLAALLTLPAGAAGPLQIYFIDVEGGQATLMVTDAGETVLIDAGYGPRGARNGIPPVAAARDAGRIMDAARDAGITRIDYLIVTHFHPDHVGGVPELAKQIPIGTFIDYGTPLGGDRMTANGFRNYEPVRAGGRHIVPQPGDRLPLHGIEATVVSAGGALLPAPLAAGGVRNSACVDLEDHPEDGTENYRSVGVMFRFGEFSFLDLGDLSGNTLTELACPIDRLGPVSAYLIAHHGDYDSNVPALYSSLRPRVAIMNNGVTRGASPVQFDSIRAERSIEDLWQLHFSHNEGVVNAADTFIANVDDGTETSYWLKLTASDDGTFSIVNARNGFARTYGGLDSRPYETR